MKKRLVSVAALAAAAFVATCRDAPRTATLVEPQLSAISVTPSPTGAKVDTDKEDYVPGETVIITGTGWAPGEVVHLKLESTSTTDGPHDWDVTAGDDGAFTDTSFKVDVAHLGVTFTLTATGAISGTSQAICTDANLWSDLTLTVGPSSVAPGAPITWAVTATCADHGNNTCTNGFVAGQNVPDGYQFTIEQSDGGGFVTRATASTTGGTATGSFTAPSTEGTYTYRANSFNNQVLGTNTWKGVLSSTLQITVETPSPTDDSPPSITYVLSPETPDGYNGWYKSDVTLTWIVTDPQSTVTSTTGCVNQDITTDQAATTYSCSATSAGGTATPVTVTIKRDGTPPTVSYTSAAPDANVAGWNNTDVTATFTATDNLSGFGDPAGLATTGDAQTSGEGSAVSVGSPAFTDNAGNTVSAGAAESPEFKIDKTAPTATASASPGANANGWNNTDVTVSFTCQDALSGIASAPSPVVLSAEAAGQSASGACVDAAGNSATAEASGINIDKTAPTVTGAATTAANVFGWYNGDVTIKWTCTDGLSGIASCPDPSTISGEGNDLGAGPVSAMDKAGNSGSGSVSGIKIDRTAPSVSLVGGPVDGGVYYFGFVPAAPTCDASDGLSGLDGSCGVSGYSAATGMHTVTARATDLAGNTAAASATYEVKAWTLKGFFQPVDMDERVFNTVKGGSTVPLKFEVFAGPTELTSTSVVSSFQTQKVPCDGGASSENPVDVTSTGGTSLRYDVIGGQFIQNWQTPKTPGVCYSVKMMTQDGSDLTAYFKLK